MGKIANLSGGGGDVAYYGTQLEILASNTLLTPLVEQIRQKKKFFKEEKQKQLFAIEDFLKQLQVKNTKDTQIVEISYEANSPDQVKFILTRLAASYLSYSIQSKTKQSKQKLYFLD